MQIADAAEGRDEYGAERVFRELIRWPSDAQASQATPTSSWTHAEPCLATIAPSDNPRSGAADRRAILQFSDESTARMISSLHRCKHQPGRDRPSGIAAMPDRWIVGARSIGTMPILIIRIEMGIAAMKMAFAVSDRRIDSMPESLRASARGTRAMENSIRMSLRRIAAIEELIPRSVPRFARCQSRSARAFGASPRWKSRSGRGAGHRDDVKDRSRIGLASQR